MTTSNVGISRYIVRIDSCPRAYYWYYQCIGHTYVVARSLNEDDTEDEDTYEIVKGEKIGHLLEDSDVTVIGEITQQPVAEGDPDPILIRIVSAVTSTIWYADQVGCTFAVVPFRDDDGILSTTSYMVWPKGRLSYIIWVSDTEEVKTLKWQRS